MKCAIKKKFFEDILSCDNCDSKIGVWYPGNDDKEQFCQICKYDFYNKDDLTEIHYLCQNCRGKTK